MQNFDDQEGIQHFRIWKRMRERYGNVSVVPREWKKKKERNEEGKIWKWR